MKPKKTVIVDHSVIDKKVFWRCILFFFVVSFIIYGKSISNEYAMDDEFVVLKNKQVEEGFKGIPDILTSTYVVEGKQRYEYRPLVKVTYAIEHQFFGESPHKSHFINILLYALAVSLLFSLLIKLLPNYHFLFLFTVAFLFLIHPLHSEVVMSLKNRDGILSFIFCLLSLRAFLNYMDKDKIIYVFLGTCMMLFAMISKKDVLPFYVIIPISLWYFRKLNIKKIVVVMSTLLMVQLVFKLIAINVSTDVRRILLQWENPLFINSTLIQRIPQGFYSIYFYLKMYIIPYPLLSYYGYNQIPIVGWNNPIVWIMILLLSVTLYLVVKNIRQKPLWIFAVAYFLICISMFTNVLVPVVGIVGERFEFIASVGLCILAALLIFKLLKIPYDRLNLKMAEVKSSFWLILGIILVVFGGQVFSRNAAWKDAYTLYKTDVVKAKESAHLHTLLAATAIQVKLKETNPRRKMELVKEAEFHYLESIRIMPDYITSLNNLGMVYYSFYNKPEVSIPYLKKAILLDTNYVEAYFNLASCEAALKQYDLAEKHYLKSLEKDSTFIGSYASLSGLYASQKRYDKVLKLNQGAIDKGLNLEVNYINLGNVYFVQGDTLKALPYLEKGISINLDNRYLNSFLADYYKRKGDLNKANHYFDLMAKSKK